MKQYFSIHLLVPFGFVVLGILWLIPARQLPSSSTVTLFAGPSTFPTLALFIMTGLAMIVTIQEVGEIKNHSKEPVCMPRQGLLLVLALIGTLIAYAALMKTVTFIPATVLLVLVSMLLFGQRKKITCIIVPIAVTLVVYAIFEYVLKINLP